MAPESDTSDAPPTGGTLAGQISTAFVRFLKQHAGIGPTKCRTYCHDNAIIVVMEGGYTVAETTLYEDGKWLDVRAARDAFQDTMEGQFTAELERLTGRRVTAFLSASHQDPDLQIEIFTLEPENSLTPKA